MKGSDDNDFINDFTLNRNYFNHRYGIGHKCNRRWCDNTVWRCNRLRRGDSVYNLQIDSQKIQQIIPRMGSYLFYYPHAGYKL